MPKQGQRTPDEKTKRTQERQKQVADGGKTRIGKPSSGRSGSQSAKN